MIPATPLSLVLKTDTQELHTRAERHDVQRSLVGGQATTGEYGEYLAQMYRAHEAFEGHLRACAGASTALASLVQEHHYRVGHVLDDLAFLGVDGAGTLQSGATARFAAWVGELAARRPTSLIGVLYVLEGSTNGGRYIARALRRGMGLPEGRGTRYFDPHGEAQNERWGGFKATLDGMVLSEAERSEIVAAAGKTFEAIIDIMNELPSRSAREAAGSVR